MQGLHHSPALVKHHKKKFGGEYATNGGEGAAKQAAGPAARGEPGESRRGHLSGWVQAMQQAGGPPSCLSL